MACKQNGVLVDLQYLEKKAYISECLKVFQTDFWSQEKHEERKVASLVWQEIRVQKKYFKLKSKLHNLQGKKSILTIFSFCLQEEIFALLY